MPNHSTPIGLLRGLPDVLPRLRSSAPGSKPRDDGVVASRADRPVQPPTSRRPRNTSGAKPSTIRKNCSTSL